MSDKNMLFVSKDGQYTRIKSLNAFQRNYYPDDWKLREALENYAEQYNFNLNDIEIWNIDTQTRITYGG